MSSQIAANLFDPILSDAGDSCLVGIMICDITLSNGKRLRVVSLSSNMIATTNGTVEAHIKKGQGGSQVHMEIYHFERLKAVLTALTVKPPGKLKGGEV